jgi:hypothetical protein
MATISVHHDETVYALKQFNISDEVAFKIGHFVSVFADNPNKIRKFSVGNYEIKFVVQSTIALNNALHKTTTLGGGSSVSYFCVRPATFYCSSEDRRNVNYGSTAHSQDNDPNETVRHSMLSSVDQFEGIKVDTRFGLKEDQIDGVNAINSNYGFSNIVKRKLTISDFYNKFLYPKQELLLKNLQNNTRYISYVAQDKAYTETMRLIKNLKDSIDKQYLTYLSEINKNIKRMEEVAKNRGKRFGWEKIFSAALKAKTDNFTLWDVDENDSLGTSGLALLGVGIHALQDAEIHKGASMETIEGLGIVPHIEDDEFIGDSLKLPTYNAVLTFLIASENYKMLKPFQVNSLKVSELGLIESQSTLINKNIIYYSSVYVPKYGDGSTMSSGK